MRELQTSTLSNQNISADLLAATYTADADRAVIIDVALDQVAGGGDYLAYVTKQKLGSGSFYKSPLSYNTAAAGVTAVWFTGIILAVKNTDVIKVYVKGLAGDTTTPDVTVSVCELAYLRPTVAGRTLDVAATGEAGLDFDNIHDADSEHDLANISISSIPSDVWSYSTRTLTQAAAEIEAAVSGAAIAIRRGDSFSQPLTGLGSLADYDALYFTVKASRGEADSEALIQIKLLSGAGDDGLMVINGEAAGTAGNGEIVIDDEGNGDITVNLNEEETAKLPPGKYIYDVQIVRSTGIIVYTPTEEEFEVVGDITRATA